MRIVGRRTPDESAVYEVYGFRYLTKDNGEKIIVCTLSESTLLLIVGEDGNIEKEQSEKYIMEIFTTGCLNLLEEPVKLEIQAEDISVSISSVNENIRVPVTLKLNAS